MLAFCTDKTVSVVIDEQQIVGRIRQRSGAGVVEYPTNDVERASRLQRGIDVSESAADLLRRQHRKQPSHHRHVVWTAEGIGDHIGRTYRNTRREAGLIYIAL